MSSRAPTWSLTAFLLAFMITLGCANESPEKTDTTPCFTLGYLDITASAPLFIAQHYSLFDSAGLCTRTREFRSSNQLVNALAANRIDYVVETSAVPALALESRSPGRVKITAASAISEQQPFDAILVRSESDVSEIQDLEGKTIGVFPGTTATSLLTYYLQNSGVDTDNIRFSPTSPPNMIAALTSGAVGAIHAYEPTWAVALTDSTIVQIHGTVYGRQITPNPQGLSLISTDALRKNRSEALKLISVFDSTLAIMQNRTPQAREALGAHFNLPNSVIQNMHLLYMLPHDKVSLQPLNQYAELLHTVGELDSIPAIEPMLVK